MRFPTITERFLKFYFIFMKSLKVTRLLNYLNQVHENEIETTIDIMTDRQINPEELWHHLQDA